MLLQAAFPVAIRCHDDRERAIVGLRQVHGEAFKLGDTLVGAIPLRDVAFPKKYNQRPRSMLALSVLDDIPDVFLGDIALGTASCCMTRDETWSAYGNYPFTRNCRVGMQLLTCCAKIIVCFGAYGNPRTGWIHEEFVNLVHEQQSAPAQAPEAARNSSISRKAPARSS